MNITNARLWVRDFARNAGDSSMYPDTQIDRAIQAVCSRFLRVTRCLRATALVNLLKDDPTFTLEISGFRPDRLVSAHIDDYPDMARPDWGEFRETRRLTPQTGVPDRLVFPSWLTGEVYPTPNAALTMKLLWLPQLVMSTDLNIPDDMLYEILTYGVPALLQHPEPEHQYTGPAWARYLEYERSMTGVGSLGARSMTRSAR